MKKNKKNNGFTLFELLVSISIIGIMTALATVSYSGAQKKARDARRVEDIKAIQVAAEQYYSQSPTYLYPVTNMYTAGKVWTSAVGTTILAIYPSDPKGSTYGSYSCGATCNVSGYCICALVEDSANANADGTCNFSPVAPAVKDHYCAKNQQ